MNSKFPHLVATLGPLVGAALAFFGYFGHHHLIAYVVCALLFWKRAAVEDVISSLQGAVSSVATPPAASTAVAKPLPKPRIDELADGLKAELASLDQTADQAVAAKNAGHAKVAALKG